MLKYMLDTNMVIYVIKHKPPHVRDMFNRHVSQLCVSNITVAELVFGAENSQFPERNLTVVENFLSRLEVLDYNLAAAMQYGQIKAALKQTGQLISDNDLHIAAHARSKGLILVSNNLKEFNRVPALQLENWIQQQD